MAGADLTEQQRGELQTLLGSPLEYPKEFKAWLPDFLAQNIPYLPLSQISGSGSLKPWYGVILNDETTAEFGVWGDIFPTAGPRVDQVSGGEYLAIWGHYYARGGVGGALVKSGISIDGSTPAGAYILDAAFTTDQSWFNWKATRVVVPSDGALHFVKLKYYADSGGGAVPHCQYRWLILLRIK